MGYFAILTLQNKVNVNWSRQYNDLIVYGFNWWK